jgi:DNA polymerase-4
MPMARAQRLCPAALVVPVPRRLCSEKSRAIRSVLERFAPVVEPASIDEAYLDLTGTERLYRGEPLAETARRIGAAVLAETQIQVSIGGGTNRLVAKLAVARAKPAGVHIIEPGGEAAFLLEHDIGDIPGVGPVLAAELLKFDLKTVGDGVALSRTQLDGLLGERRGAWLYDRMRGIDDAPLGERGAARSMSRDETFARDLHEDHELGRELRVLVCRLGADLRAAGVRARTITVRLRDYDFRTRQASRTLRAAVETDRGIHAAARPLLARLRAQRRVGARLIGVAASNLVPRGDGQPGLFDAADTTVADATAETERDRALAELSDRLRARFGAGAIVPGDLLGGER